MESSCAESHADSVMSVSLLTSGAGNDLWSRRKIFLMGRGERGKRIVRLLPRVREKNSSIVSSSRWAAGSSLHSQNSTAHKHLFATHQNARLFRVE
jgi:hypothetical protein